MRFGTTIILLFIYQFSYACSCIGKPSVKNQLKKSNYAFTGKVLTKTVFNVEVVSKPGMIIQKAEYLFKVSKVYKGKLVSDTLKVITGIGKGDCGYIFNIGDEYIIYAVLKDRYYETGSKIHPYLYTNICMRTALVSKSEIKTLEKFRRGRNPPKRSR